MHVKTSLAHHGITYNYIKVHTHCHKAVIGTSDQLIKTCEDHKHRPLQYSKQDGVD